MTWILEQTHWLPGKALSPEVGCFLQASYKLLPHWGREVGRAAGKMRQAGWAYTLVAGLHRDGEVRSREGGGPHVPERVPRRVCSGCRVLGAAFQALSLPHLSNPSCLLEVSAQHC